MTAPTDAPLNLTLQTIMTWGSWGLTAVALGVAVWWGVRTRSGFYVLVLLAAMAAAFAEPLYDIGLMLWFHTPGLWTHFSAFDIPQPNWTHSGYAILYGVPAMVITRALHEGRLDRSGFYRLAAMTFAMSCAFEMIGINGGVYQYWGPHVLRILNYPLVIGVLETAQVSCFAIAASELRRRGGEGWRLWGLFVLFPATFYLANFGAGSPLIIALHLDPASPAAVWAGTLLSLAFAAVLILFAAAFVPRVSPSRS